MLSTKFNAPSLVNGGVICRYPGRPPLEFLGQLAIGILFGIGQIASGETAIGQFAMGYYVLAQVSFGEHVWTPEASRPGCGGTFSIFDG